MRIRLLTRAPVVLGLALLAHPGLSSTMLYTNGPCIYLLVSNNVSQTATLLGTTGAFSGSMTVPVYVKSTLFNVTAIAPGAFRGCGGLTSFVLAGSSKVATIGAGAFWGCTNLSSVILQDSVNEIGSSAFLGCSALTGVDLSVATGLIAIADQTFCGCSGLASAMIPSSVADLGRSAFRDCAALANISVPSGVAAIPDAAFQGCGNLVSATFSGATQLGVNAFAGSGLTSVNLPAGLTNVAQGAFADCGNLAQVTYEGAPTAIGSAAFKNCTALTGLPVPSSVTRVASTAFDGCTALTEVTLPTGVVDIPDNLFENCTALVSVVGAVTNVGEYAFAFCGSLTNVTLRENAPNADGDTFDGSEGVIVYYYAGTSGWKNLLAHRPTVMLGADGAVEAISFAAWAVRQGLVTPGGLSDATLAAVFDAESASMPGVVNGAVYAFGNNLTADDQTALLRIYFDGDTPIVETPALAPGSGDFVAMTVEGTDDLTSDGWDLAVNRVALADVTRAGFTPAEVDGALPPAAFFRLRITLGE